MDSSEPHDTCTGILTSRWNSNQMYDREVMLWAVLSRALYLLDLT